MIFTNESAFVTIWDTNKEFRYLIHTGSREIRDQIILPLVADGSYDFVVDWGDGTKNNIYIYNDPATTHTYPEPGIYRVEIRGMITGWAFNNKDYCYKLIEFVSFHPVPDLEYFSLKIL